MHEHGHHHGHHHDGARNLGIAFLLNLTFTLLEIAGGLWTNSVAILTDAVHDGGDCLSLGLAWYLHRYAQKRSDAKFTYGYRRFSNLGALITGVVLIVGLGFVGWHAVERLWQPAQVHAPGMLAFAVLGVIMNGAAAWRLRGGRSLNEKIVSWHLIEDTLGWVAVLIGSAVMTIWDLPIIDPLLALIIAVFILVNIVRNLKQVALVFLQSAPPGVDMDAMRQQLANIDGVLSSHHTHTWSLDGETHIFSTHLVMACDSSRERVIAAKQRVHEMLHGKGFSHITIEVEFEGEACGSSEE